MKLSNQVCQLLALCLVMTAVVDGMRVRVRGRRPQRFRHGRPRRPTPVFLAVPGGEAVPVFPLGGHQLPQPEEHVAPAAPAEPEVQHTSAPLPLEPSHPEPTESASFGPTDAAEPAPTEFAAAPRPAALGASAFENFDEDFFSESGPFGGSFPQFPDISSIFADGAVSARRDAAPSPLAEARSANWGPATPIRRVDSGFRRVDSPDSSWPSQDSQDYADLYFRASSPKV